VAEALDPMAKPNKMGTNKRVPNIAINVTSVTFTSVPQV
jgi:hypothetical protein